MSDKNYLASFSLFAGCAAAAIDAISPYVAAVSCKRYQEIYREGAPTGHLHLLVKGEVGLEKERGEGLEPMRLAIVRAGEYFGLGEFMLERYYTTATALTDCRLLQITKQDFKKHFMAIDIIRDRVMTAISEIARYLMFSVAAGSGVNQLALYLRHLSRENGKEVDGKIHIQTKVLQPEVASLLNMSREHVTRLFAKLQEQGVVAFNQGYPIIDTQWLRTTVTDADLADCIVYRDYPRA